MDERRQQEFNCSFSESEKVKELKRDRDNLRVGLLVTGALSIYTFSIINYSNFFGSLTDLAQGHQTQGYRFGSDYTGFGLAVLFAGLSLCFFCLGRRYEKSVHEKSALEQKLFEDEQKGLYDVHKNNHC